MPYPKESKWERQQEWWPPGGQARGMSSCSNRYIPSLPMKKILWTLMTVAQGWNIIAATQGYTWKWLQWYISCCISYHKFFKLFLKRRKYQLKLIKLISSCTNGLQCYVWTTLVWTAVRCAHTALRATICTTDWGSLEGRRPHRGFTYSVTSTAPGTQWSSVNSEPHGNLLWGLSSLPSSH